MLLEFRLGVMRCCETVQTKDSAGRPSYQKSKVGKSFAEHMSWICGAMLLPWCWYVCSQLRPEAPCHLS